MKAVIVAAGIGSRLNNHIPKTLLSFGGGTILSSILANISQAGINRFVIVVGYESQRIKSYLEKSDSFGFDISFVDNPQWRRGNGISVLAAEESIDEDSFLLSMSDHIVSVSAISRIASCESSANLLLVDPKVDEVFDIDDATKVKVVEHRIVDIGKHISDYNAIDCGIFKLTPRFFTSMRRQLKKGEESISASIRGLIEEKDMEAVFLAEGDRWIDIDTPESYDYALRGAGE
jgi:choline kinase